MCPVIDPDKMRGGSSLPPGKYQARIASCEQKVSRAGNEYLNWKFETIHGESNWNGRAVFLSTTYSGKGAKLIKTILKAAFPDYGGGSINTDQTVGRIVTIAVDDDYDQNTGEKTGYPRVTEITPPSSVDAETFENYGT